MVRFGHFVFDPHSGELRNDAGSPVMLRRQLSCILSLLTSRPGEVVTREELRQALWGDRVVDFDGGLNFCIKRLREALGDDAEAPRFIETLPKRGYRFITAVTADTPAEVRDAGTGVVKRELLSRQSQPMPPWAWVAIAVALLVVGALLVRADLRQPATPERLRMAVLPFQNLSGDPEQNFVSAGLTDDLTTQLGRLAPGRLVLVAVTSTPQNQGGGEELGRVGRELDIGYVLAGSVRVAEQMHVNVRLIRVADRVQLWADSYERSLGDIGAVQGEIAQRVARALALELLPAQQEALARASTTSSDAYREYLQGMASLRRGTEVDFQAAIAAFERARQDDPEFAMAYAGLAATHFLLHDYGFVSPQETCDRVEQAVERAASLDDGLPQSHVWQAEFAATCANDRAAAEREFRRALELNPSDAATYRRYGWFLLTSGHTAQALEPMQAALALDSRSADAHAAVAYVLLRLDREHEALKRAQAALRIDPQFPFAMYVAARAYAESGRQGEAVDMLERAVGASGRGPKYLASLGMLYSKVGRRDEARRMLDELNAMSARRYVPPAYVRLLAEKLAG